MASLKESYGLKRICQSCLVKYYDLNKTPITCPSCGEEFDPEAILTSRRSRVEEEDEESKKDALVKKEGENPEDDLENLETPDVEISDNDDDETLLVEDDDEDSMLPEVKSYPKSDESEEN